MPRPIRTRPAAAWLAVLAILPSSGCVSSDAKDRVAAAQTDAVVRLSAAYAEDLAGLRAAIDALARIEALTRREAIESALVARYLTPAGEADLSALEASLSASATEPAPDALVAEVRAGGLSPDTAREWLSDYALAWRMTAGAGTRDRLLSSLTPMREGESARAALLAALDAHAAGVARLFADALASGDALARSRALEREFAEPAAARLAEVWRKRVLARVTDPGSRRLLESVLADFAPDLLPAPTGATP